MQGSDKELESYGLGELAERHLGGLPPLAAADRAANGDASPAAAAAGGSGAGAAAAAAPSPLQRLRRTLEAAVQLGEVLHGRLSALSMEVVQAEMQVCRWAGGVGGEQRQRPGLQCLHCGHQPASLPQIP